MRTITKILNICFFLAIACLFLRCTEKSSSTCDSLKIKLLLEDIFRKKELFIITGHIKSLDSVDKSLEPIDSSSFFNYLFSSNLKIPKEEYYLHLNKSFEPSYPDSVRLKVIDEPRMKKNVSHVLDITLLEVNRDTTKVKISFVYSENNNILKSKGTFSYLFDKSNCKWIVQDSTILFH